MALELVYTIEGEDHLLRNLEGIEKDLADWRDAFSKAGSYLQKTFRDNFYVQGALLEKPWAPLKETTIAAKIRRGEPYPAMPLLGSGKMSEAFRAEYGMYHVRVFNPIEYFKYHQSNKPRRVIPRRVMISLTEKMKQKIIKMFQLRVEKVLMRRSE